MTVRLAQIALDHWRDLDGWAMARNMPDLRTLPLDRFCNLVWYYATRNAESDADRRKFENELWRPPLGAAPAGPWSAEAENAAFQALKGQLKP